MGRNKRPVRGGKRRFQGRHDERHQKPKKEKRGKFDVRTASYIKERQMKNDEIEMRRKMLEEEKRKRKVHEEESSEEEDFKTPLDELMATFKGYEKRKLAVESDEEEEEEANKNCEDNGEEDEKFSTDNEDGAKEEEEISITIEEEGEEDAETAKEDAGELDDPFSIHFRNDLDDNLYNAVSSTAVDYATHKLHWPNLGNMVCMIPQINTEHKPTTKKKKLCLLENKQYAKYGEVPRLIKKIDLEKLHIKSQIRNNLSQANYGNMKDDIPSKSTLLTPLQKELFSIVNNYQDLLYMERTFSNSNELTLVYCLHAINHILKTRTKILHHNAKLQKSKKGDDIIPDEYRDQGLVRPKVLILIPFRDSCLQIVKLLIAILIGEDQGGSVVNKNRFMEDFSGGELAMPKHKPKPEDYEQTFKGNIDDNFKIGISITKKTLKLYADFYTSDIIIASPLGLRMLIGTEGEAETDYDYLASIELLILDQSDVFMMQNWEHLYDVINHLHLQPKSARNTDFARVRSWCVNGWTKYYRQTLIFSSLNFPLIHSIFNKQCHNYFGKVKVVNQISPGSIAQVIVQLPQVFQRMDAASNAQLMDTRLEFFTTKILPHYRDSIMNHTLIFVPSYYDYVVLRNYMKKEELSFVQICEYSKDAKVARARDMFFHSDAHFMLYTERAHFYRRREIKGIRHLIMYSPPSNPYFYSEMCNMMLEINQNHRAGSVSNMTVTTIFSKHDSLQLAAIVGTERANKMLKAQKDVHMLMTKD